MKPPNEKPRWSKSQWYMCAWKFLLDSPDATAEQVKAYLHTRTDVQPDAWEIERATRDAIYGRDASRNPPPTSAPVAEAPKPAPEKPKPATTPKTSRQKKERTPEWQAVIDKAAARREKLRAEVPAQFMFAPAASEWVHFPGAPEMLVNKDRVAIVPKAASRRRESFYKEVPKQKWNGREFWVLYRNGKRTYINVGGAMTQCGFWLEKPKAKAE
jgi:hypothetical protein